MLLEPPWSSAQRMPLARMTIKAIVPPPIASRSRRASLSGDTAPAVSPPPGAPRPPAAIAVPRPLPASSPRHTRRGAERQRARDTAGAVSRAGTIGSTAAARGRTASAALNGFISMNAIINGVNTLSRTALAALNGFITDDQERNPTPGGRTALAALNGFIRYGKRCFKHQGSRTALASLNGFIQPWRQQMLHIDMSHSFGSSEWIHQHEISLRLLRRSRTALAALNGFIKVR